MCHLNIPETNVPDPISHHQAALEFLSNLTPGSFLYNLTVQRLRRTKRHIDNRQFFHKRINTNNKQKQLEMLQDELNETITNRTVHLHLNRSAGSGHHQKQHQHQKQPPTQQNHPQQINNTVGMVNVEDVENNITTTHRPHLSNNETTTLPTSSIVSKKVNSEKYWKKYKNFIKQKHKQQHRMVGGGGGVGTISPSNSHQNPTPMKVSHLILNTSNDVNEEFCLPLAKYSLLFCCAYILFVLCVLQFLFLTESAVFTVAVVSIALPVGGIFWSIFELTTEQNVGMFEYYTILNKGFIIKKCMCLFAASIVWAPEITGELICSLLGTPIVLLGIFLFSSAHINDTIYRRRMYTSLSS